MRRRAGERLERSGAPRFLEPVEGRVLRRRGEGSGRGWAKGRGVKVTSEFPR